MNNLVVNSVTKFLYASILFLLSTHVIAIPMKGSLGVTGAIKSIDHTAENVVFENSGWTKVTAAGGDFLDVFEVEQPGPGGNSGSWINYYNFGASSVSGDLLWSFDEGYDGTIDLWYELDYFHSIKFDGSLGTMEILGRGFLTNGVERVESHWNFNATQKGDSIVFSSAFAVSEPTTLILLLFALAGILIFRNNKAAVCV